MFVCGGVGGGVVVTSDGPDILVFTIITHLACPRVHSHTHTHTHTHLSRSGDGFDDLRELARIWRRPRPTASLRDVPVRGLFRDAALDKLQLLARKMAGLTGVL
jgi:hypothetical protein